jgi:hypothetical protein
MDVKKALRKNISVEFSVRLKFFQEDTSIAFGVNGYEMVATSEEAAGVAL